MISTLVTFISIFACTLDAKWYLGMNMNPCDGSNFGYGGPWADNSDVGTTQQALTHDFLNNSVWNMPVGYITIARHHNAICEMSKTWEFTDKSKSIYEYFSNYPGRIYATGDGSQSDTHIQADMPTIFEGQNTDPIFGADGGLVFNWWYSNNGARIANPGGYKIPYSLPGTGENNDDLHGLGCEFGANTQNGEGSSEWWHDAAQLSGDCHGGSCFVVGTDHGTALHDGPCTWGNYAIYVSKSAETFTCQGMTLTPTGMSSSTAVDCQVSNWSVYSICSVECGGGIQTRTRNVDIQPENGGTACPVLSETQACNDEPCRIDCVLGEWYNMDECDLLCGTGTQHQQRNIITNPQHGGTLCETTTQTIDCNTQECCPDGINTFDWDEMMSKHINVPEIENFIFGVDTSDLTLNIYVELPYLGKTSANNQIDAKFGTTYVIDFEDFNAHSDAINQPGTCQNRVKDSFEGKTFNDFWTYSQQPQNPNGIGNLNTLSYPPSDKWTMSMKNDGCDTIIYERSF
eukprot:253495_1